MRALKVLALTAALVASTSAMAFADDEARQAILDLRKEVRTLQEQLDMQKSAQMQLMTQINRLTEQNRMLTGQSKRSPIRFTSSSARRANSTRSSTTV